MSKIEKLRQNINIKLCELQDVTDDLIGYSNELIEPQDHQEDKVFVPVTWPDIQTLMEEEGFEDNSTLINDYPLLDEFGDSSYLVRLSWLKKVEK